MSSLSMISTNIAHVPSLALGLGGQLARLDQDELAFDDLVQSHVSREVQHRFPAPAHHGQQVLQHLASGDGGHSRRSRCLNRSLLILLIADFSVCSPSWPSMPSQC